MAEIATEATHRVGSIYLTLSRDLMASQRPAGLSALELEQYELLLEEQAFPIEEQAIDVFETNVARMDQGVYNVWIQRSIEALAEIVPLLSKHARALEQMRADDHPRHQSKFGRHDALWRLRFLLSANGDAAKATANARKALAQREAVGLDAIADFVWRRPHWEWPGYAAMRRVCPTVVYAAESGQLVVSVRFGECDFHQPRDVEDAVSVYMYHLAEWMRLYLDCATRRSGRLVKEIRLQAFDGSFSLQRVSLGFSRRFAANQAKIGGVYPQRVAHEVACDPPAWLYAFYRNIIAPLTPIGLREKLLVLSLAEAGDRERLDALLGPNRVPTHLGGPLDLGSVKDLRERRLEDVFR